MTKSLTVYLAGEIHSDWRQQVQDAAAAADLPLNFLAPCTDHGQSDNIGTDILGLEDKGVWKDHKGAGINNIRFRTAMARTDVMVVRFGPKYKQWNAAFEAGYAVAMGKPLILMHDPSDTHALKEVAREAMAVVTSPDQVVSILGYVTG